MLGPGALKLQTELFDCGTYTNVTLYALSKVDGVLEARRERGPEGTEVVVAFDPAVVGVEDIAQAAKDALESDELLEATVTVRVMD